MSPEEVSIEELWDKYDVDKNGFLEKDELAKFIIAYLISRDKIKSE